MRFHYILDAPRTYLVSGCIIMQKSDILNSRFGAATFVAVLQFYQNNFFIELACDCSAFWHRDLKSWTLISEQNSKQNLLYRSYAFGNTWASDILLAYIRLATFRFGSK